MKPTRFGVNIWIYKLCLCYNDLSNWVSNSTATMNQKPHYESGIPRMNMALPGITAEIPLRGDLATSIIRDSTEGER